MVVAAVAWRVGVKKVVVVALVAWKVPAKRLVEVALVEVEVSEKRLEMVLEALFTINPPEKYDRAVEVAAPTLRLVKVPTLVRDEETTAEPRAVALKVFTPLILYDRPVARFILPETY